MCWHYATHRTNAHMCACLALPLGHFSIALVATPLPPSALRGHQGVSIRYNGLICPSLLYQSTSYLAMVNWFVHVGCLYRLWCAYLGHDAPTASHSALITGHSVPATGHDAANISHGGAPTASHKDFTYIESHQLLQFIVATNHLSHHGCVKPIHGTHYVGSSLGGAIKPSLVG